jgi:hypothetical protein
MWQNRYRIKAVLNVETDIIASITESLTERVVILVIIFVETFKTDIIIFIGNIIFFFMSHRPIYLQYKSQFDDTENITLWGERKNVQITDNNIYLYWKYIQRYSNVAYCWDT